MHILQIFYVDDISLCTNCIWIFCERWVNKWKSVYTWCSLLETFFTSASVGFELPNISDQTQRVTMHNKENIWSTVCHGAVIRICLWFRHDVCFSFLSALVEKTEIDCEELLQCWYYGMEMFSTFYIHVKLRCCPCPILWGWQYYD